MAKAAKAISFTRAIERLVSFQSWQPIIRFGAHLEDDEGAGELKPLLKFGFLLDIVGADRVLVLAYKHLNADSQGLVDAISAFCGRPAVSVRNAIPRNRWRIWMMQKVQRCLSSWFHDNELSPRGRSCM
ncbi:MAG TPA: hypothetical protein VKQ09_09835 [Sphingomonas sp.]|nr:hypothetical protein [Sphingomonas sp.]